MLKVEAINSYSAALTIIGWFAGLAYYNWFASHTVHVPL